ncbi:MAG: SBBP repeat-containing protein [Candidatus Omnitrophota bacterium]
MSDKKLTLIVNCFMIVIACLAFLLPGGQTNIGKNLSPTIKGAIHSSVEAKVKIDKNFGQMPLYFIPNQGQLDKQVFYYIQGKDKTVYFTSEGVTFFLSEIEKSGTDTGNKPRMLREIEPSREGLQSGQRWTVKLDFVGARQGVKPVAIETAGGVISYFKGKPEQWKTGIPLASKIMYRDLWPGIDLVYYGTTNRIKYEFIVHPGADPSMIKLAYRGVSQIKENGKGQLVIKMPFGSFYDDTPVAWQEISGKRTTVSMKYAVTDQNRNREKSDGSYTYGFSLGKYDKTKPLVMDPVVIIYCGYIGGNSDDRGYGIAVDDSGCAYVAGITYSTSEFPVQVGPDTTFNGGISDVFVAKVNADGSALVYCGYIGGSGYESESNIAVDASGCAYIVGGTDSSEGTFPVKSGPGLTYNGGQYDAFVAKINADGTGLVYCGYIGGTDYDSGASIAVDDSGYAYVVGTTVSTEATFPVKGGPCLKNKGNADSFVAKVNADGTGLVYCGYIGGSNVEYGNGIAIDSWGCAYIVGYTYSSETDSFPVKVGPDLTFNHSSDISEDSSDTFVAKVSANGTELVYCGYIGGTLLDEGYAIAVDPSGCAYVTGKTWSSERQNFPVKVGPDLSDNDRDYLPIGEAFVAKVTADGCGLGYCGYIGGSEVDAGFGITVDAYGCAYVTGITESSETSFPVKAGPELTFNGFWDAFVAKVKGDGSGLDYCGYLGGRGSDEGCDIAVDCFGNAYIIGLTYSPDLPVKVGPGLTYHGNNLMDTFVAKIWSLNAEISLKSPNGGETFQVKRPYPITWTSAWVNKIKIELYNADTFYKLIADNISANTGTYFWIIPSDLPLNTNYKIKLTSIDSEETVSDISDNPFTLTAFKRGNGELRIKQIL